MLCHSDAMQLGNFRRATQKEFKIAHISHPKQFNHIASCFFYISSSFPLIRYSLALSPSRVFYLYLFNFCCSCESIHAFVVAFCVRAPRWQKNDLAYYLQHGSAVNMCSLFGSILFWCKSIRFERRRSTWICEYVCVYVLRWCLSRCVQV